jgi:hypothetical protein
MDGARLQGLIYKGYGKAAARIGLQTDQYRAKSASSPLATTNKIQTLPVSFNAQDWKYMSPNKYGNAVWYAVMDATSTLQGDYLSNAVDGTFFVASLQTNLPITAVQCNHTLNMTRPAQPTGVGAVGYSGDIAATETALMTGWPASVLMSRGGRQPDASLPADASGGGWEILFPQWAPVVLRPGDIATDETGRRYLFSTCELTDFGWRIRASMEIT